MSDDKPTVRRMPTICGVATPRTHHSTELYAGAELMPSCARPGAYAAFALPSIYGSERREPTPPPLPARLVAIAQARERQAGARRAVAYEPRPGGLPAAVLAHLAERGGHLTFSEVALTFSVPLTSVAGSLKPATDAGALVRHPVRGRYAVALPGHVWPPDGEPLGEAAQMVVDRPNNPRTREKAR